MSVDYKTLDAQVSSIISEQVANGWLLDQKKVLLLLSDLKEKKDEYERQVHKTFPPVYTRIREVTPKFRKDGCLSPVGIKYLGDSWCDVGGVHTRVELVDFNLGSRQQIAERLQASGWVPTEFTETGHPIVSEATLEGLQQYPEAQLIANYLMVQKRIAMAQSWLDFVGPDGRVHGEVDPLGCITTRMSHSNPNMGQVTASSKPYGSTMRECWIARKGYCIVGMDASGLELRMLAHYMDDDAYTSELLEGDIHSVNQKAAGLDTRDMAKTFIYAFLYGAGDAKIGSIIGGTAKDGRQLKQRFLKNLPALKTLKENVGNASKRGWLKGLDGRKIVVRSQHAALNTLLQGAGAIVMKQALVNLSRFARAQDLSFYFVGNIHDEIQTEVLESQADRFGKLACFAMAKAGSDFNLRIPLAGEYKVGNSWKETH